MPDITGDGVNDLDITPAGSSTTIGGVIFTDAVNTGSGTGNYNTFLAISDNDGVEEGFNSDDTPPIDASNKDIDQAKTHTVKLSSLVVVTIGGVQYYEFRVDLNEANSDPNAQISLDQFKLYTSTNGGIVDTTTLFSQNLIYDMDAGGNVSVLLSDAESSGSGTDDYAVLVPVSEFAGLDPTTTYVYLYAQMGAAGANWNATATFEEWNLQNGVTLTGTKFEDLNNNGVKDAGEGPIQGVTIFIDANKNGTLDAGERTTVTDANGNYSFFGVATGQTVWIDEVVPAGATQTTGAHEEVIIASNAAAGSTTVVDPIGNFLPHPAISITKAVHDVDGDTTAPVVDAAGDIVNYTIDISNTGNVTLTGLLTEDQVEALSGTSLEPVKSGGFNTGDTNTNGTFDPGETWHFTAAYTVTQDDIDDNGGGNGILSNIARATTNQTAEVTDDADVPIELNPAIAIEKTAVLDDGGDCVDQDGDIINYTYSVTNAGNVALDNVVVVDDKVTVVADDADLDGYNDGDTDADGLLDVNETWTYSASYTATQDDIDNAGDGDGFIHNNVTANGEAAVSGEAALEATDDADVEVCPAPAIAIDKTAVLDDGGDCVDQDGDIIRYTYSVTNAGNVALDNVVVVDDKVTVVADDADLDGYNDGDTDADGLLDVNETWTYSASYTATQDDIDNNGDGGSGFIHNNVTANGEAAVSGEAALEATDDADVEVCPAPAIAIDKTAVLDDGGDCVDQDGDIIRYTYSVTNAGNVALDNVVVVDDKVTVVADDADLDGYNDGDTDADGLLDVNETWTYSASYTATQDDIDNNGDGGSGFIHNNVTANGEAAVSGEAALEATDDADVEVCPAPAIAIDKTAVLDDGGDCVDQDGDIIRYTYSVTNAGNLALDNVVVVDDKVTVVADDADLDGYNDGDTDADGLLDVNETWTYSASYTATQDDIDNAGDGDGFIHNNVTANGEAAVSGEAALEATDDADVEVCQLPAIAIEKTAVLDDGGDCVDEDGDIINYTYSVTNAGNVALDNVVVVDDKVTVVADDADLDGYNDGDTDADGLLDVNETWTYSASYTATQDDIDNNGDGDGFIHNNVTANGEAAVSGEAALEATDEADVEVCQLPAIDLEKYVMTDVSGVFADADDPDGLQASTSTTVDFKVVLTNTGNVTLTDITLSDSVIHTVGGVPGAPVAIDYSDPSLNAFIDLNGNATLDSGEEWANFDTNSDGTLDVDENSDPFELSVGETVSIYYSLTSLLGQHENTAVVTAQAATSGEAAGDQDDANYYVLDTDDCVGVRTPGFWANTKWMTFWDAKGDGWGTAANEPKQAGTPGFADGELLYGVDSNADGFINHVAGDGINDGKPLDAKGLLIGDYNLNGFTDAGEDTIFIGLADAIKLINASSKQLAGGDKTADGIYMLGRDMVATWLNYLANNQDTTGECIGDVSGVTNTPREYLDAAIDWMQQFASTTNGTPAQNLVTSYHDGNTQATFQFDAGIHPSSASWQFAVTQGEDIPVSAAQMHSQLDAYNNTGAINGIEYCCDADSEIALHAISLI